MTEETNSTKKSSLLEVSEEQDENIDEVSQEETSFTAEEQELFDRMMEAGVFYGRSKSKTNPLTKNFILTTRSGFEVIDLKSAIDNLKKASDFLKNVFAGGGTVLFVGTSPASKNAIRKTAEKLESPYVSERWLGGTLTNFKTISDRINYFKKLKEDKRTGKLEKYTKKEQLDKDKELMKLERLFGGIESLEKIPSAMFIADLSENGYAAREAKQKGVPVVAFVNTDTSPKLVSYPIPGNDRNASSVELLMEYIEREAEEGKKEGKRRQEEAKLKGAEEKS